MKDIAFRIISGNQYLYHDTISDLRIDNLKKAFSNLFLKVLELIKEIKADILISHFTLNGTKDKNKYIKKHKVISYDRIVKKEIKLKEKKYHLF